MLAIFSTFLPFLGALLAPHGRILHILVEEVLSFNLSGVTSKSVKNWLPKLAKSDRITQTHQTCYF